MKLFVRCKLFSFLIALFIFLPGSSIGQPCDNIIYVSPTGVNSGTGSQGSPVSLPYAFTLVSATSNQLWLAVGNYTISNDLPMISGITMEGGFDPTNNWIKTNAQQTVILRNSSNMDTGPNRIVAVECDNISNFSIHDITIITADASSGVSTTTYGIHLANCSSYILSRLTVTAGNATNGIDGVPGADGVNGANGQMGQPGDEDGGCCTGGQGGYGATGGKGGGGSFGIYINANGTGTFLKDCFSTSGLQGVGGLGGGPGGNGGGSSGGAAGAIGCDIGSGGAGGDGGKGGKGGNGGNGAAGLSLPLYEDPNSPAIAQSDMKATVEPAIYLQNTGCTFHDINYTTNATGIVQWFFDGGSNPLSGTGDSVKTQYSNQGRHSTTLVVDGVPYMFSDFTGIFKDGTPFLPTITGSDTVCPGSTGSYSASFPSSFTVSAYNWKMFKPGSAIPDQEGSTATFNYTFPDTNTANYKGTYMITLQTQTQCCGWSKIDTFYVKVVEYLNADVFVSANTASICDGESAGFFAVAVNGGDNPGYDWKIDGVSTGVNSNSFFYSLPYSSYIAGDSTVTVTMTSSYPCPLNSPAVSLPFNITVFPLPAATCSSSGAFLGANTVFNSIPSGGNSPYTYNWDFGDGGIDTAASPSHLFGGTGPFTYSLSVTDANGCTGTCNGTVDITIAPYVQADFSYSSIISCGSTTVSFTDNSIGLGAGSTPSWLWDFGDGTIDSVQNPTHTYTNPGNYSVTLTASNGVFDETYLAANIVAVKTVPVASITYVTDTVCYPLSAHFMDDSPGAQYWLWDFGDGSPTTNLQNPSHTYTSPGTFTVTLIVTSPDSCSDTTSTTLYNLPAPVASFTLSDDTICNVEDLVITDNTSSFTIEWDWYFGDGTYDSVPSPPAHQYTVSGNYWIYLNVKNGNGCLDDTAAMVTVLPTPVADFSTSKDSICNVESISFSNNSSADGVLWSWDFGDGSTDNFSLPAPHSYPVPGLYPISLIVENDVQCKDTVIKTIKVMLTPVADFSISDDLVCSGEFVEFTDNSSPDVTIRNWTFGNGITDTTATPSSQQYNISGIFDAQLIVGNGSCADTLLKTNAIEVKPQPDALFIPDTMEIFFPDNDIVLKNLSINSDNSPIVNWVWDFGNGTLDSTNFNATAVYSDSGAYTITLITRFEDLCFDTMEVDVYVGEMEAIYFANSFTPNADGLNDIFYVYGKSLTDFKMMIFNRWGDLVFESVDMSARAEGRYGGWDGKINGSRAPNGQYAVVVEYKLKSTKNKIFNKVGSLILLGKK